MLRIVLLASLTLLTTPAFAIYKCEKNGAITYSDQPCANGTTLSIDTTPSDATTAKRRATDDEKKLKQLEREHRKQELEEQRRTERQTTLAAKAAETKHKRCTKLALQVKWADEDVAKATLKSVDKEKLKARRAKEKYESECGR